MSEITPTTDAFRPPTDQLHDSAQRVLLDVPARVVFKVLLVAGIFWLLALAVVQLSTLIVQFAIAAFLAVAADPVIKRLQAHGLGRGRAVALLTLAVVLALSLFVSVFVPPLVEQGNRLIDATPSIIGDVRENSLYQRADREFGIVETVSEQAERVPGIVSEQLGTVLARVLAGVFGTLTILFLTIFLLLGGGQVVQGAVRLFPTLAERRWWSIVQGAYTGIAAYVGGVVVIALIAGTVMTISAVALGLPYALPLGLWMGLLVIIPLIGATIGAVPAVIVAFAVGGPVKGVVMIVIVVVYQQLENLVIQPRVQGRAASLSPLVVFVSVLVGSSLLGVLGALFAVPVAGVLQIFLRQVIAERGDETIDMPHVDREHVPLAPDVDDDGRPGRAGIDGRPL